MATNFLVSFINENAGAVTAIFTVGLFLATLVLAFVTWVLYRETRLMRKSQTDPKINIFIDTKADFPVFMIVVKNEGNGIARNINFNISYPEFDYPVINDIKEKFSSFTLLDRGIVSMPPNKEYRAYLVQPFDKLEQLNKIAIPVEVTYFDDKNNKFIATHLLTFSHFEGIAQEEGHVRSISDSLKDIVNTLNKMIYNNHGIYTISTTEEQKKFDEEEYLAMIKERFSKKKAE